MNSRILTLLAACALAGCTPEPPQPLQGYVEGEFVLVAAPNAGVLQKLHARRGQQLEAGAMVFELEQANEDAARREVEQRLRTAEQRLANLREGRRPAEVEAAAAQAEQAEAARRLSGIQLKQNEALFKSGFISQAQLDSTRAGYDRDMARAAEIEAQNRLAKQSVGRDAEIRGAAAEAEAARAALAQADWRLGQRSARAPAAAMVQDTYFLEGEWVPAGRPVASLLPPQNVKVRFFVAEAALGSVHAGDAVRISCDGCGAPIGATVSYISRQAEYTPPVLYSKDSRAKLVFMIEARPAAADAPKLRPGQPVDVTLAGAARP